VYGPIAHILVIPSRTHDTNTAYVDFESEASAQKVRATVLLFSVFAEYVVH
jgi:hypothetical protein